jgi:DNA-binding CsgD family transcriptional regulator
VSSHAIDLSCHIDRIYRAGVAPECWPAFVESLFRELEVRSLHLAFRLPSDGDQGIDVSLGMEQGFADAYRSHFYSVDPWMSRLSLEGEGAVHAVEGLLSETELLRTEFYNDWLRPQGVLHGFGSVLHKSAPTEVASSLGGFREKSRGPFEKDELERIRLLVPHLQRALAIHRRLQEVKLRAGAAEEALDRILGGVILLDDRGIPIVTNRSAAEVLARNDGLQLDRGGPRAADPAQTRKLQRLIAEAALTGARKGKAAGAALRLARPSGRPALEVEVTPILRASSPLFDRRASAAVFVTDPDARAECSPERLRRVFGLTAMEAEVAARVARGRRLPEIAGELGVTIHTVRDHLKHAFRKTGTHRQVDLVRVLLSGFPRPRPE